MPIAYVDAKGAVRDWLNSLTTTLVGTGNPLSRGVFIRPPRSPFTTAWAVLSTVGNDEDAVAIRTRLSASIYAPTIEAADEAANAYANTIRGLATGNVALPGARCLTAGNITGPLDIPDPTGDTPHRLVDADFYLSPA